jgi:hypothetical protein
MDSPAAPDAETRPAADAEPGAERAQDPVWAAGAAPDVPAPHAPLPVRGPDVHALGLPLPPGRMPLVRDRRPLKRWRYVGVYTAELMLCVGEAHVGGLPQRWWALALPDGALLERTTLSRGGVRLAGVPGAGVRTGPSRVSVDARARAGPRVSIELELGETPPVEVVSSHGRSYIWTAKRAPVHVRGQVRIEAGPGAHAPRLFSFDGEHGFIDESAGYHARRTAWRWSAGVGRTGDGRTVAWNLVDGVHDAPEASERTVWLDGRPYELEPQPFAADLSRVGDLAFERWSAREHSMSLGLVRSRYVQPFGTFRGALPGPLARPDGSMRPGGDMQPGGDTSPRGDTSPGGGTRPDRGPQPDGLTLAEGYGVMEDHEVAW